MTVEAVISAHGKAQGNLEYSSIIVSRYLFLLLVGKGPLKSILIFSKGCVDLTREVLFGL